MLPRRPPGTEAFSEEQLAARGLGDDHPGGQPIQHRLEPAALGPRLGLAKLRHRALGQRARIDPSALVDAQQREVAEGGGIAGIQFERALQVLTSLSDVAAVEVGIFFTHG